MQNGVVEMKDFMLIDLESQFAEVLDLTKDWSSQQIIEWLAHFGTITNIPNPYDNRLYSFRSPNGHTVGFRFDEHNRLLLIGKHTTRIR